MVASSLLSRKAPNAAWRYCGAQMSDTALNALAWLCTNSRAPVAGLAVGRAARSSDRARDRWSGGCRRSRPACAALVVTMPSGTQADGSSASPGLRQPARVGRIIGPAGFGRRLIMALGRRLLEQHLVAELEQGEGPGDGNQDEDEDQGQETACTHGASPRGRDAVAATRLKGDGAPASRASMSVNAEQVRHIAKLARIAMSDAEVEALVPEFNNILGWVEQLAEVDTDGVEPLTAVIDQNICACATMSSTTANVRDAVLQRARRAARLLRRAEGDRIVTRAHIQDDRRASRRVPRAASFRRARSPRRSTPRSRRAGAQRLHRRDARDCAGRRRCGRRGARRGRAEAAVGHPARHQGSVRDRGRRHHRRQSNILKGFKPPYESTVSGKLKAAGAGMLGKLNMDEFAMGSSNETSAYGPVISPVEAQRRRQCRADPGRIARAGRRRRSRRGWRRASPAPTPAARSASPRPSPASRGIKPTYGRCSRWGIVAFASLARPGRADGARRCATARSCSRR